MARRITGFRLSEAELAKLEKLAAETRRTRGDVLRQLIENARVQKCEMAAEVQG